MFSIFSSSKKLIVQSTADPQLVLQKFRARLQEDSWSTRVTRAFAFGEAFLGKVDGRNVVIRYDNHVRNSLEPIMQIHVDNNTDGGSILQARYTTHWFVKVFLAIWMGMATCMGVGLLMSKAQVFGLMFPCWGLFIVVLMRVFATVSERRLEWFLCDVVADAEADQRGETIQFQDSAKRAERITKLVS